MGAIPLTLSLSGFPWAQPQLRRIWAMGQSESSQRAPCRVLWNLDANRVADEGRNMGLRVFEREPFGGHQLLSSPAF